MYTADLGRVIGKIAKSEMVLRPTANQSNNRYSFSYWWQPVVNFCLLAVSLFNWYN